MNFISTSKFRDSLTFIKVYILLALDKTEMNLKYRIIHPSPLEEENSLWPPMTTNIRKRKDLDFSILAASSKIVISSSPMTDLLPRFHTLVAPSKTIKTLYWLYFQNRVHQLLHLSRKFSLLLLCFVRTKACLAKLNDGGFD